MKKNQIEIVDCFIQLMVYTLEFKDNFQEDIYTIDKLMADYEKLIEQARVDFEQKTVQIDFNDALFPFVAWIDEVILSSEYKEKKVWQKNLLQKRFFITSNAGYEFYERLDSLEPSAFILRLMYLYCLFLGFRGRYYRDEDKKVLKNIFEEKKLLVGDSFKESFPKTAFIDAYAQNPSPQKKIFKTSYSGILVLIGVSLIVGLVIFLAFESHLNGLLSKYNIF